MQLFPSFLRDRPARRRVGVLGDGPMARDARAALNARLARDTAAADIILALDTNPAENVRLVRSLLEAETLVSRRRPVIAVHAASEDCQPLLKWQQAESPVDLRVFRPDELSVRWSLAQAPWLRRRPNSNGHPRIWCVGWDGYAEAFVLAALRNGISRRFGSPRFVLVGDDAQEGFSDLAARRPSITRIVGAPQILSCWRAALEGREALPESWAVYVADPEIARYMARAFRSSGYVPPLILGRTALSPDEDPAIAALPAIDWSRDPGLDRLAEQDAIAAAAHALYLEESLQRGQAMGDRPTLWPWQQLAEPNRNQNRHVADHLPFKLADIGARLTSRRDVSVRLMPDEIEELAQVEHARWQRAMELEGWTYAPVRDDDARRHPALRPFDELDAGAQEYDRLVVKGIPHLAARAGLGTVRDMVVTLTCPGPVERGFGDRMIDIWRGIRARYPDRHLIIRTRLRSEGEYLMACSGLAEAEATLQLDSGGDPAAEQRHPDLAKKAETVFTQKDEVGGEQGRYGPGLALVVGAVPTGLTCRVQRLDGAGRCTRWKG